MRKRSLLLAVAAILVPALSARALDTVFPVQGAPMSGKITAMTANEVSIETRGEVEKVPVNQITTIRFDGEPPRLNIIRSAVRNGRYEDAIGDLNELDLGEVTNTYVKADISYMKAYSAAKLALQGQGDVSEAGRQLLEWTDNNQNHYKFLEASELLGDLLVSFKKYEQAISYYDKLARAPFPDMQMRGALAKGRALLQSDQASSAKTEFDKVLSLAEGAEGPKVESYKLSATLGQAQCLTAGGQLEQAVTRIQDVIKSADPEDADLHARAYSTLGDCYKESDPKKALLAYLHVDLLYFNNPQLHAEALSNIAELYNKIGDSQNAIRTQQRLQERYPNL